MIQEIQFILILFPNRQHEQFCQATFGKCSVDSVELFQRGGTLLSDLKPTATHEWKKKKNTVEMDFFKKDLAQREALAILKLYLCDLNGNFTTAGV